MPILSTQTLALHRPHCLPSSPSLIELPSPSQFSPIKIISPLSSSSTVLINPMELKKTKQSRGFPFFTTRASSSASCILSNSEEIGELLGNVSIFTAAGEQVAFKDLWDQKEGMAVVALLRHFGCPCCWELASALKASKERFDSAGVKLIAVGVGTPDKAQILAERLPFPVDCLYCDPERKAYDVLGLYYGLGRTFFSPATAKVFSRFGTLKKAAKNYTIKAIPKDKSGVLQQGGMYVFKGKQLLYSRKDEGSGDHAPLNQILDICCTTVSVA